jgi:hypothetical protein
MLYYSTTLYTGAESRNHVRSTQKKQRLSSIGLPKKQETTIKFTSSTPRNFPQSLHIYANCFLSCTTHESTSFALMS